MFETYLKSMGIDIAKFQEMAESVLNLVKNINERLERIEKRLEISDEKPE